MSWQQEKKRLAGKLFSLKPFGNVQHLVFDGAGHVNEQQIVIEFSPPTP